MPTRFDTLESAYLVPHGKDYKIPVENDPVKAKFKQFMEFAQYVINLNSLNIILAQLFLKTTEDVLSGINKLEG